MESKVILCSLQNLCEYSELPNASYYLAIRKLLAKSSFVPYMYNLVNYYIGQVDWYHVPLRKGSENKV